MKTLLVLISLLFFCGCNIETANKDNDNTDNSTNIISNSDGKVSGGCDCSGIITKDGDGGFLYKPEGENTKLPVVLFPEKYDIQFEAVQARLITGDYDSGVFSGFTNVARQTWRFGVPANKLTGSFIVQGENESCEIFISDPTVRND